MMGMVKTYKIIKKSPEIRVVVVISQCVQIIAHEEVMPLTGSPARGVTKYQN